MNNEQANIQAWIASLSDAQALWLGEFLHDVNTWGGVKKSELVATLCKERFERLSEEQQSAAREDCRQYLNY